MKKLLIIEDNWMMRHMIEEVAVSLGIQVTGTATSWEETEQLLCVKTPDFAIVDININGSTDGIGVARHLKDKKIPFLFLTAYKDIETITEAAEISPLSYLIKPVTPENLVAALMVALTNIDTKTPAQPIPDYTTDNSGLIYKNNVTLILSKSEHRVLGLLLKNISHTVSYETLFYNHEEESTSEATLRNVISKLRKRCPDLIIQNIKDVGYIAYPVN
jgi:DNA-binding response OmpR family regulator